MIPHIQTNTEGFKMICKGFSIEQKKEILDRAHGQYFSVVFKKLNGEVREMTCKLWQENAYTYGSKNAKENTCKNKPNIYTVCDVKLNSFRNIDLTRIKKAKIGKVEYEFED